MVSSCEFFRCDNEFSFQRIHDCYLTTALGEECNEVTLSAAKDDASD
jgi:hypothetical protein